MRPVDFAVHSHVLQITKTYVTGYDSILNAMEEMGTALPQFQRYAEIFGRNDHLKHVLCLFYKDILEFHMTVLDFFHLNSKYHSRQLDRC